MDIKESMNQTKRLTLELTQKHAEFRKEFEAFAKGESYNKKLIADHINNLVSITSKITDRNAWLMVEVNAMLDEAHTLHKRRWRRDWIIGGILIALYILMTIINLIIK